MSLLSHTRGALLAVTLAPLAAGRGAQPSWTDLAQRDLAATQFIAASFFGPAAAGAQQADRQVDNLRAFARLYGYVRFFHPSDEAASIDWDRFAVLGAQRVKDAGTTDNLLARLGAFFRPIAPSVVLYREGTAPPADRHVPTDTAGLQMVAWQHQGALIAPSRPNAYWSLRTNRAAIMAVPAPAFASLTQAVDATPYRGRRVRLRAHISARVQGAGNQAQMWLRVDREGSGTAFIDNMSNRPVMHAEWREYEVVAPVDSASSRIHFGALLLGMGEGRWDSFELAVEGEGGRWIPVPIADGGFEAADSTWSRVTTQNPTRPDFDNRWSAASAGFDYGVTTSGAAAGAHAAFIRRRVQSRTHPLFDVRPARGEVLDVSLGSGLRARVPVALFSDGSGTHPRSDATALASLTSAAGAVDVSRAAAESPDAWLGGVVIAWNVLQHFYPYFDVVRVDWPAELDRALKQALADRSGREFQVTLRRLMAALDDGHAGVSHPDHATTGVVPWLVEWVVGQAIVTASADTSARRGDIVVAVDDVRTADLIAQAEQVISGSPQWKRVRAVSELGAGVRGTAARVMLARDGRELEVQLARTAGPFPREFDRAPIVELEPGIRYVDLTRAPWTDINAALPALAVRVAHS